MQAWPEERDRGSHHGGDLIPRSAARTDLKPWRTASLCSCSVGSRPFWKREHERPLQLHRSRQEGQRHTPASHSGSTCADARHSSVCLFLTFKPYMISAVPCHTLVCPYFIFNSSLFSIVPYHPLVPHTYSPFWTCSQSLCRENIRCSTSLPVWGCTR